jgi:4-carboxymuconolactone decarboxylase
MDTRDLDEKGLKLRREMFGNDAVDKRMKAFGAFGEPLQHIINAYAYGDVWSRPALPLATKSLAMVAMMAGAGRTNELRVHVKGALTNGCTAEQIQDILLLVAMYCGIPAANEPIALRSMCCARPKRPNRAPAVLRFLQLGFVWPGLGVPAECREAKPSGTRAGNCYDC